MIIVITVILNSIINVIVIIIINVIRTVVSTGRVLGSYIRIRSCGLFIDIGPNRRDQGFSFFFDYANSSGPAGFITNIPVCMPRGCFPLMTNSTYKVV